MGWLVIKTINRLIQFYEKVFLIEIVIMVLSDESTCSRDSDDYSDGFGGLFGPLAQVNHSIAGGEDTGTPQEALQELSVELVADDELAQIEAYSQIGARCENEG